MDGVKSQNYEKTHPVIRNQKMKYRTIGVCILDQPVYYSAYFGLEEEELGASRAHRGFGGSRGYWLVHHRVAGGYSRSPSYRRLG